MKASNLFLNLALTACGSLGAMDNTEAFTSPGNPVLPGIGLCDPHYVIYGDRAWVYATHDFSPANKKFVMKDWWVWSTPDFVNWKHEGTLQQEREVLLVFLRRPDPSRGGRG